MAAGMIFLKHKLGPVTPHLKPFRLLMALEIRVPQSLERRRGGLLLQLIA
jgi:hypothetical protein